jgi:(1->4)-alpha-D-glucan 1-alpha-D-glucosylmutase
MAREALIYYNHYQQQFMKSSSTYRIQFHAGFTFKHLDEILDYLYDLGISTIYASPIFKAAPGSQHGYDVTDPHQINPEIGTIEELRALHLRLEQKGMTWLQDIVPNHMAFHHTNTRLYDVLERGPLSPYYEYFDIDWQHPSFTGKVIAPFLGKTLEEAIADREITLGADLTVNYFGQKFPLSISAYDLLGSTPLLKALYQQATLGTSLAEWTLRKSELLSTSSFSLEEVSPELLLKIVSQQYYQLTRWSDADDQINYRRFFTVNELITLHMETQFVFDEYHTFLHSLYRENLIQGLRIDHIDGLRDPAAYIHQLRQMFGSGCYIIAEKILEYGESLPADWSLQGTSGYEFLSYTNHLLSNHSGEMELRKFYQELVPSSPDYEETVYDKKRLILQRYMGGEWENLVRYCYTLKLADDRINREKLKEALGLFMLCLPVYRLYHPFDEEIVRETFVHARSHNRKVETEMALLESFFEDDRRLFIERVMQFTGPLTAKGVEDTTFYVYNPFISFNEVGDSPGTIDFSLDTFHKRLLARQQHMPLSLNATSTHDTKRGEDARIRLNMLTLFPAEWKALVSQWPRSNLSLNDIYFIYQSVIAGFPPDGVVTPLFIERLQQYFLKAVREAKVDSAWSAPNEAYEKAGTSFIQQILTDVVFLNSISSFITTLDEHAFTYSLVQTLVKITAPGIPDIYQGCELWDYSYVDPDNRRPVDYPARKLALTSLSISSDRPSGLQKLFVTSKALHCRKSHFDLFTSGDYLPLQSSSPDVLAYARAHRKEWAVVVAPLPGFISSSTPSVLLPAGAPSTFLNIFTGEEITVNGSLSLSTLLKQFPIALLISKT